ncbi:MAG: translation initiation factor [Bacteroidaceae bacterium]
MKKNNDWKDRLNIVYSTSSDFSYEKGVNNTGQETLEPRLQDLRVQIDKKNRRGKSVTLITGFVGTEEDLNSLGRILKTKCGVGGAVKEGGILIQGDHKQRIIDLLKDEGYLKTKGIGG